MPGGTLPNIGNVQLSQAIYASITPPVSVGAASSTTSTYTILGLLPGDLIDFYPQAALTTYLVIGSAWVSAANTLSIQWVNSSASTSSGSPTAISFGLLVNRASLSPFGITNWPQAIE